MDSCRVEFRRSAEKDLRRIATNQLPQIVEAIRALENEPLPPGVRKLVGGECFYRIRIGDYRVVFQWFARTKLVVIEKIRHRKDVYRE